MKTFNVYEKKTMMYVDTITISIADVRKYEKDFVLKQLVSGPRPGPQAGPLLNERRYDMDNTTKFFWLMRRQALEKELKHQQTLRKLVQNIKDRNEEVWDEDEASKTEWVLQEIDENIRGLEEDLKDEPNLE